MKIKTEFKVFVLSTMLSFFILGEQLLQADSGVKIWEEPLTIPTYRIGDPELNPMFYHGRAYQGARGVVYPYPFMDRLTDIREDRTYRAVYLENRYIKVCVLPEIGGRIFSAKDKTNGYDFFYHQHVIKPALIGMLGAWISGGVEWNFPHHHRATAYMPVDYTIEENPGGSKTLWIGELEYRHRMKWIIGLTLYPDKSYLEVSVRLFNRTPFVHSFLYWANVAVHANQNYQVIFPPSTQVATYHGKNQFTQWPISREVFHRVDYTRGVDVSWWKNLPLATSMFAWNCNEDFLAGYDHGKNAGVLHIADHHLFTGKKFWTWGTGGHAQMWEKILTETDGPYLELMVGAYSDNQPDYSWLQPYEVKMFVEYWYPFCNINGVKNANRNAAVNLEIGQKGEVTIGMNTTAVYPNARVMLMSGEECLYEKYTDISPEKPFYRSVNIPTGLSENELNVVLLSSCGEELISYSPVKRDSLPLPEPVKPPPAPEEINSVEELYFTGLRLEQLYNPARDPLPYYWEALKRDPGNFQVNKALGIHYLKRGMLREAEESLRLAVSRATENYTRPKDVEASYYLGVVLRAKGNHDAAVDLFHRSSWDAKFHSAACYQLAEMYCKTGDFVRALEYIDRSLQTNAINTRGKVLRSVVMRKLKCFKEAEAGVLKVLSIDPLDFWAGNELVWVRQAMGKRKEAIDAQKNLRIKMRGQVQSYLEVAVDYMYCSLWEEAIDLLMQYVESMENLDSLNPLVAYYLGYLWEKMGDYKKGLYFYQMGAGLSYDYVFPFRFESLNVLRRTCEVNPNDARAYYYIGNFLYDNQPEKAIEDWERSRALDSTISIVHRNLGLAYFRNRNDLYAAAASLERAIACNPEDPRLYYELDLFYEKLGKLPKERLALLEKNHHIIVQRDDALSREIMMQVQCGHYSKAIGLLENHHFHVWEGGGKIYQVYADAHLLRGLEQLGNGEYDTALEDFRAAIAYPENFEVGRPEKDSRALKVNYLMGIACEASGEEGRAMHYYNKAAEVDPGSGWSENRYYQGLVFQKLGSKSEAEKVFNGLITYGKRRLKESSDMDFFAKFGVKQSREKQMAHSYYLQALGYHGKGMHKDAAKAYGKALNLDSNHLWARFGLSQVK